MNGMTLEQIRERRDAAQRKITEVVTAELTALCNATGIVPRAVSIDMFRHFARTSFSLTDDAFLITGVTIDMGAI